MDIFISYNDNKENIVYAKKGNIYNENNNYNFQLSNGFKLRNGLSESNGGGVNYIYMAWAEEPGTTPFDTFPNAR